MTLLKIVTRQHFLIIIEWNSKENSIVNWEKLLMLSGLVSPPSKSQSGWKFKNNATESWVRV